MTKVMLPTPVRSCPPLLLPGLKLKLKLQESEHRAGWYYSSRDRSNSILSIASNTCPSS